MVLETVTVKELIGKLEEYPPDVKVYYSTKYALTPLSLRLVENDKYLIIEMSDDSKDLFHTEY